MMNLVFNGSCFRIVVNGLQNREREKVNECAAEGQGRHKIVQKQPIQREINYSRERITMQQ